jgi:diguanylate cyclase (GGDEF)-like protein
MQSTPPIRHVLWWFRRWGLSLLLVLFALGHLSGVFGARGKVTAAIAFVPLLITTVSAAVWRIIRLRRGEAVAVATEARLALLLLELSFALVQFSGDRQSALYPAIYLFAALFAVAPWPRSLALGLVLITAVQNALRYVCADVLRSEWSGLVVQTGFIAVFAVLYHLLLAARLKASRVAESQAVAQRLREAEESARRLRLIVADRSRDRQRPGDEDQQAQKMLLGAVLEVEQSVGSILEGAHLALAGHAVALYWLNEAESKILLRDGRCPAGLLAPGPLSAGDGILGSVLRHGATVQQTGKFAGVNWYLRDVAVRSVAAVPVIEKALDGTGYVRGVLVADRLDPAPFSERDVVFLEELAGQIARASEAERLVSELHRSKETQDRLHRAAEELNAQSTIEEVSACAVKMARQLVPALEFVAVTRVEGDESHREHVVCGVTGPGANKLFGLVYDDNDGLVAHVARLGAPLPPKPPGALERIKIFDMKSPSFGSLRVMPLLMGTRVLGTLVVAADAQGVIGGEARQKLEELATLIAGALSRAMAFAEISKLATVDGLTGLANRRQLDILSAQAFQQAARYGQPLSVLVTDVDHFKKVNDTYGHAAGDDVLKGVASILAQEARTADVVGRYGGEEFVVLMTSTDTVGAAAAAERIRQRIEATEFHTNAGPLRVTLSIGVASHPHHGQNLETLVHSADGALYRAKHQGRNRVVVAEAEEGASRVNPA